MIEIIALRVLAIGIMAFVAGMVRRTLKDNRAAAADDALATSLLSRHEASERLQKMRDDRAWKALMAEVGFTSETVDDRE